MKIIDCFPFFDEFMILDIRFRELGDLVDQFYIVESPETFTGKPKPLSLTECYKERYPEYAHKITIVNPEIYNDEEAIRTGTTQYGHSLEWRREYYQKNHISGGYLGRRFELQPEDIILFSDADEIPRRSLILDKMQNGFADGGECFNVPAFYYKFNIKSTERVFRGRYVQYKYFSNHSLMRYAYNPPVIEDSGWHFTSIKSAEDIKKKIEAFSHQEYNNNLNNVESIQNKINTLTDLFAEDPNRPYTLERVDIDDSFPEYIKENQEKLKDWIL